MTEIRKEKTVDPAEITDSQLESINRLSRRELQKSELFVFSVILCDNEIDRDGERFPIESLRRLGELFLGKTGLFDHSPKAENQNARIFETQVLLTGEENSMGEDYACLKGWAYMVRCEKNLDLILEIDAGIKKEVSVGCAVDRLVCSVCQKDQKTGPCAHQKGERYGGELCHHLLADPTDAYEWSFVAVPAQRKAGVTKYLQDAGELHGAAIPLEKLFGQPAATLTGEQLQGLERQYRELKAMAEAGEQYRLSLQREVVKLAALSQPGICPATVEGIAKRLELCELEELREGFAKEAAKAFPLTLQLGPEPEERGQNQSFTI